MMTMMCDGLDGSNPLHFLAALGVLRLLSLRHPETRVRWEWQSGWRPEYCWEQGEDGSPIDLAATYLGAWLRELGSVDTIDGKLDSQIRAAGASLNKLRKDRDDLAKTVRAETRGLKLNGDDVKAREAAACLEKDNEISHTQNLLEQWQNSRNDILGVGIAHLGDVIGVPASLFRNKAKAAVSVWLEMTEFSVPCQGQPQLVVEALAAQACDAITDARGNVRPTPLSFSNGASGHCLLKDFRCCAVACTDATVSGFLRGNPVMSSQVTGLNWNPADQRSYALQWQDPANGTSEDPAANALAFVGLLLLIAIPGSMSLGAVGWVNTRRDSGLIMPIWAERIVLDEVRSLLAVSPALVQQPQNLAHLGIHVLLKSIRINPTGKRNFFAPAVAV